MAFRNCLLFVFLIAVASATPGVQETIVLPKAVRMAKEWQLRALRRSRARLRNLLNDLANLETNTKCKDSRRTKIRELLAELRNGRTCRYHGVGLSEYNRLRALCRDRSEVRGEISLWLKRCAQRTGKRKPKCIARRVTPLKEKLKMAFEACRTIGWKGESRIERDGCPNILKLKEELAVVEAIKCGKAPVREELLTDIENTKGRIAYLLGLIRPKPSAEPRPVGYDN